uniref:Chitinase n=1 Tax=Medicago truncatula TaxID=3880 RepID=I3SER5_MEDTR|nr:unknown [Medicago truncatula]
MNINYVDYKFYNQTISTENEFDELYNQLVTDYGGELKLLVGVSPDPSDIKMKRQVFIEGAPRLINNKSLPGLFVWSANDFANPPSNDIEPYILEEILLELFTNN